MRKWFAHDPDKWPQFQARYKEELKDRAAELGQLREELNKGSATLLYAAKDEQHNQAVILQKLLRGK